MQKRTLLIVTCIESCVEVALWHLGHVIFMQELALVTLLAEPSQPMLANNGAVTSDMPVRALGAIVAVSELGVELADCCCRFCKTERLLCKGICMYLLMFKWGAVIRSFIVVPRFLMYKNSKLTLNKI